jgi:hypothetical protein
VTEATQAASRIPDSQGLSLEEKIRVALQQVTRR